MSKVEYGQNMKLVKSYLGEKDTFKLIPINNDCPYLEMIYDPTTTMLIVVSNSQKEQFTMVPRLDDNGDRVRVKGPARPNSNPHKEQRQTIRLFHEHYVIDSEEQEELIKDFAVNFKAFPYEELLRHMETEPTVVAEIEKPGLVDDKGIKVPAKKKK